MFGFNPRFNVTHQWTLVALICLALFGLALALPTPIGAPLSVIALFGYAQFMYAATARVYHWQEPFLVRWYGIALCWWEWFSQPLEVGFHAGQVVYMRRPKFETSYTYYNAAGYLVGYDDFTNWSYSDMDWKQGDPESMTIEFRPASAGQAGERMSWLSRLRSPALPEVLDEEDRVHPFSAVLNHAYDGEVIHLQLRTAA